MAASRILDFGAAWGPEGRFWAEGSLEAIVSNLAKEINKEIGCWPNPGFWSLCGAFGKLLGAFGKHLGSSWEAFGELLGDIGELLGVFGEPLRTSWEHLGAFELTLSGS